MHPTSLVWSFADVFCLLHLLSDRHHFFSNIYLAGLLTASTESIFQNVGGREDCKHINRSASLKRVRLTLNLLQSTPSKPSVAPNSPRAESPTTARPLDFDDEPQDTGATATNTAANPQTATETPPAAPPKPPRPLSPREQSENTLKEAFPSVDASVIKAILTASNWNVERAFNALLGAQSLHLPA